MTEEQLQEIKEYIESGIEESLASKRLYTKKMEAHLVCMKLLIELGIVESGEERKVEQNIFEIVETITDSLKSVSNNHIRLDSRDFKSLLLEMVEKNVIKRFDTSTKFDGIEDEVVPENICSIYVNYYFYQNILLLGKSTSRKKEEDLVIFRVIELIRLYIHRKRETSVARFYSELVSHCPSEEGFDEVRNNEPLIERYVERGLLAGEGEQTEQKIFKVLILLFYNSNTYSINYETIKLVTEIIFRGDEYLGLLNKSIFIVNQREQDKHTRLLRAFEEIRLLIETSEIWLRKDYEALNY